MSHLHTLLPTNGEEEGACYWWAAIARGRKNANGRSECRPTNFLSFLLARPRRRRHGHGRRRRLSLSSSTISFLSPSTSSFLPPPSYSFHFDYTLPLLLDLPLCPNPRSTASSNSNLNLLFPSVHTSLLSVPFFPQLSVPPLPPPSATPFYLDPDTSAAAVDAPARPAHARQRARVDRTRLAPQVGAVHAFRRVGSDRVSQVERNWKNTAVYSTTIY